MQTQIAHTAPTPIDPSVPTTLRSWEGLCMPFLLRFRTGGIASPLPLPHHSEPYLHHPSSDQRLDDHCQAEHGDHSR